jgi:uncharacterized protein
MTTTRAPVDLSPPVQIPATPDSAAPAIADPGPLGLGAFAMTTFVLSVFNTNIPSAGLAATFLPFALFYGGIAQFFAGMWEFRKNNTFGALAFSSYGAFWLALAAYIKFVAPGLPAAQAHQATGVFLLAWTIFTAYMLLASMKTTWALVAVFVMLFATFILLTWAEFGEQTTVAKVAGWTGIVTAVLAWYHSAAGVTNSTWGRTILPVFPVKK